MTSNNSLNEDDIPGASLKGRNASKLKNDELKFWLKCRGDSGKGLKTKAELVKRVEEFIKNGKGKQIVDPDPNQLYTRRKLSLNKSTTSNFSSERQVRSVKYSEENWGTSLEKMPLFTKAEMDEHIVNSGKKNPQQRQHKRSNQLEESTDFSSR